MSLGFITQAVKLYPKRKLDWLVALNLTFAVGFILANFFDVLRISMGLITVLAFVKLSVDRMGNLKFRISHFVVLIIALVYTIRWLV